MRFILLVSIALFSSILQAQDLKVGNYSFSIEKEMKTTAVQNQNRTSTCWSFATLSFIESEIKRIKGVDVKLSEMWIVRHTYMLKAERYIRMHGNTNFAPGGGFHDVTKIIEQYGMVPQDAYPGLQYGSDQHNHSELNAVLNAICDALIKNPNGSLTTAWKPAIEGVLDAYLGARPQRISFSGKTYTPKEFAAFMDFNASDYVEFTSFTHHPYYQEIILEIPDNWMWGSMHNMPLNEFLDVAKNALSKGYTLGWAADVSETGFSHKNGLAVVPVGNWQSVSRNRIDSIIKNPHKQETITAEMRQLAFDNYQTQDDHAMHLVGYVKEANGDTYYFVKNSWGATSNSCGGYLYASEAYLLYKTIAFMVHKEAIPKAMIKKLDL